jgi:peroxiredoxin
VRILSHIVIAFFLLFSFNIAVEGNDPFVGMGIILVKGKKPAPNFHLKCLRGKDMALKDFTGNLIFLNFWATWCGPCREEMPSLEAVYQGFKGKGFILLTISVDYAGEKVVKEFMEKHRYTFPVLLDPKCSCLDLFDIKGIPSTLIIDKGGRLIGRAVGPRNWNSNDAVALIHKLLQE